MPIYEFVCEDCGSFDERRSFEEAGNPATCPACGSAARRIYSAPGISRTPAPLAKALNRSEKSAHEPEIVRQPSSTKKVSGRKSGHSHGRPWTLGH
ncbi:MAG: zinc ribbon domain-containing protein [Rubrobacteraceae bacterium]